MPNSSVFALKNSGLEAFLYAELGDELNGSGLTVLSAFARLGLDPWAEAARLVDLPKAKVIECVTGYIARMPLSPPALAGARATAARLASLLPTQNTAPMQKSGFPQGFPAIPKWLPAHGLTAIPKWLPMALLFCALAFGLGVNLLMAPAPAEPPLTGHVPQQGGRDGAAVSTDPGPFKDIKPLAR